MKTSTFLTLILSISISTLFGQSTDFQFLTDDGHFLRFRTNAAGEHYIEQDNSQSSLFFGFGAGMNNSPGPGLDGEYNTAFGQNALQLNTTGQGNTAFGASVLDKNTTGDQNIGIGYAALFENTEGSRNIAIGRISLRDNTSGGNNIAVGESALLSTNGTGNTAVGWASGTYGSANFNTYLGYRAGRGPVDTPTSRSNNVMLGTFAGEEVTTSGNVMIGYAAGQNSNAANGNQLYIANTNADSTEALIYGVFNSISPSSQLVRVNGKLTVDGLYTFPTNAPTSGQFLRATNLGPNPTLSWANIDAPWSLAAGDDVLYEDGDVGIGTGDAIYRLDVQDSHTSYVARFRNTNTGNSDGIIVQAGSTTNPTSLTYYALFLDGDGTNVGAIRGNSTGGTLYSTTSDRRLKQNIETYTEGLEMVMKIRPTQYQMKSNPSVDEIGFIAQELQEILPLAVGGNPTDDAEAAPMTVDYSRLTPVLVAAIQEQQQIINTLQEQLDSQNQKFEKQDQQYAELKAEIVKMQGLAKK